MKFSGKFANFAIENKIFQLFFCCFLNNLLENLHKTQQREMKIYLFFWQTGNYFLLLLFFLRNENFVFFLFLFDEEPRENFMICNKRKLLRKLNKKIKGFPGENTEIFCFVVRSFFEGKVSRPKAYEIF